MQDKKRQLIILAVLALALPVSILGLQKAVELQSQADAKPTNVKLTNIGINHFAVSWRTADNALGKIFWGTTKDNISNQAQDDRAVNGENAVKQQHHVGVDIVRSHGAQVKPQVDLSTIAGTVYNAQTNVGIGGVPVAIFDLVNNVPVITVATQSNGQYVVDNISNGTYQICIGLPQGFTAPDGTCVHRSVTGGGQVVIADFALQPTGGGGGGSLNFNTSCTGSTLQITWGAVQGATVYYYQVSTYSQRQSDGSLTYPNIANATVPSPSTSATLNVGAGTYYIIVAAGNSTSLLAMSPPVGQPPRTQQCGASTTATAIPTTPPGGAITTSCTGNTLQIAWPAVSSAAYYIVQVGTSSQRNADGSLTTKNIVNTVVPATQTSFSATVPGTGTYYVVIGASNAQDQIIAVAPPVGQAPKSQQCGSATTQPSASVQPSGSTNPSASPNPSFPPNDGSASITTDKQQYTVGDPIQICYTVPGPSNIKITVIQSDGQEIVVVQGFETATGDCMNFQVELPAGNECLKLEYSGNYGSGTRGTCYNIIDPNSPSPSASTCPTSTSTQQAGRQSFWRRFLGIFGVGSVTPQENCPSPSPSSTATATANPTGTPTPTGTATATPTPSGTTTPTPSPTTTATPTPTPTPSPTSTLSPSASATATPTPSGTTTPIPTAVPTATPDPNEPPIQAGFRRIYFKIESGGSLWGGSLDNLAANGAPLYIDIPTQVSGTSPVSDCTDNTKEVVANCPDAAYGLVKDSNGNPVADALVSAVIQAQGKISSPLTAITNNEGRYVIDIGNAVTEDFKNYIPYNRKIQGDTIKITVTTNVGTTKEITSPTNATKSMPDVIFETSQSPSPSGSATPLPSGSATPVPSSTACPTATGVTGTVKRLLGIAEACPSPTPIATASPLPTGSANPCPSGVSIALSPCPTPTCPPTGSVGTADLICPSPTPTGRRLTISAVMESKTSGQIGPTVLTVRLPNSNAVILTQNIASTTNKATIAIPTLTTGTTYSFALKGYQHLTAIKTATVNAEETTIDFGTLIAGDIVPQKIPLPGDDLVEVLDASLLKNDLNKQAVRSDLNSNGTTDVVDYSLLKKNLEKRGATATQSASVSATTR